MLFAGDLAFNGGHPFVLEGSVAGFREAHRADARPRAEVLLPGHGPVCRGDDVAALLDDLDGYLAYVEDVAAESYAAGLTPLEAAQKHRDNPYADLGRRPSGSSATSTARTPPSTATRRRTRPQRPPRLARHGRLPRRPHRLPRLIPARPRSSSVRRTRAPSSVVDGGPPGPSLERTRAGRQNRCVPGPTSNVTLRQHHLGDAARRHGDGHDSESPASRTPRSGRAVTGVT